MKKNYINILNPSYALPPYSVSYCYNYGSSVLGEWSCLEGQEELLQKLAEIRHAEAAINETEWPAYQLTRGIYSDIIEQELCKMGKNNAKALFARMLEILGSANGEQQELESETAGSRGLAFLVHNSVMVHGYLSDKRGFESKGFSEITPTNITDAYEKGTRRVHLSDGMTCELWNIPGGDVVIVMPAEYQPKHDKNCVRHFVTFFGWGRFE